MSGTGAFVQDIDADSFASTAHGLIVFFKGQETVAVLSSTTLIDVTGEPGSPTPEELAEFWGEDPEPDTTPEPETQPQSWGGSRGSYL